jgi:succinate dehydrogenase / fumarate reductase flavoprotein subunit/fumarate reductase flavoprotein subunit
MAGRGTESGGVYIDLSHLDHDVVRRSFPGMVERCHDYGFDLVHDRVEVSPSAHYQMGGVAIKVDCSTSMECLFAAGEDAGGVHGANRLGGNGVADSIVYGGLAGNSMADFVIGRELPPVSAAQIRELSERWATPLGRTQGENVFALRRALEDLMWQKVGVVRNGNDLESAIHELTELRCRAERVKAGGPAASNPEWNEALNLINLCMNGEMVARSAALRKESRGAHYRQDFPQPDRDWLCNIFLEPLGDGVRFRFEPVDFSRLNPYADNLRNH